MHAYALYTCICTRTHIRAYLHVCLHTYYTHVHTYKHACRCIHMYMYTHTHTCILAYVFVRVYIVHMYKEEQHVMWEEIHSVWVKEKHIHHPLNSFCVASPWSSFTYSKYEKLFLEFPPNRVNRIIGWRMDFLPT